MFGFWKESFGLIETVDADLTVSFFNTNWDISSNNIYVDIKPFTEDSNHIDISTLYKDNNNWKYPILS